jgi:hypothetical protein
LSRERNPLPAIEATSAKFFSHRGGDGLVSPFLARLEPLFLVCFVLTVSLFLLARSVRADDVAPPGAGAPSAPAPPAEAESARAAAKTGEFVTRCPSVDGAVPQLADIDARRRLAFVRQVMDDQARRARTWSTAWMVAGIGLIAGNYTRAALADTFDGRLPPLVGGTTAFFIPAGLLVRPLHVMANQRALETELATLSPAESTSGFCAVLARAELLLADSAEDEAKHAGLFSHLFVIGGNGAIALFLGLGFDHWTGALINGGGGLLISELQLNTQPTGAVSELARYRRGELSSPATALPSRLRIVPFVAHGGAGLSAMGTF